MNCIGMHVFPTLSIMPACGRREGGTKRKRQLPFIVTALMQAYNYGIACMKTTIKSYLPEAKEFYGRHLLWIMCVCACVCVCLHACLEI